MPVSTQPNTHLLSPEMAYILELEKLIKNCRNMGFAAAAMDLSKYREGLINGTNFTDSDIARYIWQVSHYAKLSNNME